MALRVEPSCFVPPEAIQAATINGANLLEWSDRVGSLEPGHHADLAAVEGGPLKDVAVLENTQVVMKGGEVVKGVSAAQ